MKRAPLTRAVQLNSTYTNTGGTKPVSDLASPPAGGAVVGYTTNMQMFYLTSSDVQTQIGNNVLNNVRAAAPAGEGKRRARSPLS